MTQPENPGSHGVSAVPQAGHSVRKHGRPVTEIPAAPIHVSVLRFEAMRAAGLQALFENNSGIEILLEESPDHPGSAWLNPAVQVVVIGTQIGSGTLQLIASIRSARPELPILIMSPAAGDEAILNVLGLGAKGFLHEATSAAEFEMAVRAVTSGTIWASRRLQAQLIERLLNSREATSPPAGSSFTAREQQVLELLLDGRSNREIAQTLKIEERTVKSYVAKLMGKTGVRNRTALSMQAIAAQNQR